MGSLFSALILAAIVVAVLHTTRDLRHDHPILRRLPRAAAFVMILPIGALIVGSFVTILDPSQGGVVVAFGTTDGVVGQGGTHVLAPWKSIVEYNVGVQTSYFTANASEGDRVGDDSVPVLSKGGGRMFVDVNVKYQLGVSGLESLYQQRFRSDSDIRDRVIRPAIQDILKVEYARYTPEEAISDRRSEIALAAQTALRDRLTPFGVQILEMQLTDVRLEPALQERITRLQQTQQDARQAEVDQQRQVTEAETRRLVAEKDAQARRIAAESEAAANRIVAESLTPEVLQARAIDAVAASDTVWVVPANGSTPILVTPGAPGAPAVATAPVTTTTTAAAGG